MPLTMRAAFPTSHAKIGLAGVLLFFTACTSKEDIQPDPNLHALSQDAAGIAPQDASTSDRAEIDSAPDVEVAPGSCVEAKGLPGPTMIEVPAPNGSTYCIDRTEVTQGHYLEFLKAKGAGMSAPDLGDTSGQPPGCEFNTRFTPDWTSASDPSCRLEYSKGEAFDYWGKHPDYPVGCVDWCDAFMYCKWAGKRLCGQIGGGALDSAAKTDATKGQWYNACSQGGKTAYAYGQEFESGLCADAVAPAGAPEPTLSQPVEGKAACHGTTPPFDQILNLSGSVAEWLDGCEPSTSDAPWGSCLMAGRFSDFGGALAFQCANATLALRSTSATVFGFRCCLD